MITISVVNQKGGVGKSTVATCLYHSFRRAGKVTSFSNQDPQGGSTPSVFEEGTEILIIDTPCSLNENTSKYIDAADILVIPTLLTSKEASALLRTVRIAIASGKPFVVVLNGMDQRVRAKNRFREDFLSVAASGKLDMSRGTVVVLPMSVDISNAQAQGMSVVEYKPRSKSARAVTELCNEVRRLAGVEPEEIKKSLFAPRKHPALIEKKEG